MRLGHTKDSQTLAEFAYRYENQWHSFNKDKKTIKAVDRAKLLGCIEVNEFNQFKSKGE